MPVHGGFCGSWVSSNVLHVISFNREYAVMNYTEKENEAIYDASFQTEQSIENLADKINSDLMQQKVVLDANCNQVHIDDFIADVEIDSFYMASLICGDAVSLQESMREKLYDFSVKMATEIIEADKS